MTNYLEGYKEIGGEVYDDLDNIIYQQVFKNQDDRFPEVIHEALEKNNRSIDDISLIIPHQANLRMACQRHCGLCLAAVVTCRSHGQAAHLANGTLLALATGSSTDRMASRWHQTVASTFQTVTTTASRSSHRRRSL